MKKKLLLLTLALLLVAGMAGAGTFAYFTDTETSTGNTFTAGTMDLKLRNNSLDPWTDGVTATWTLAHMKPGDAKYGYVDVTNAGTIEGNHMEIACDYTVTEEDPPVESDTDPDTDEHPDTMAKAMLITYAHYQDGVDDIDLLTGYNAGSGETKEAWRISDVEPDGKITLYDLKNDPLDDLPRPDAEQYTLKMWVKFDPNAGNDFQGDTLNLTVYFTLNQDASQ